MNAIRTFIRYWLPVILWAGVIFYLSSIPSLESGLPVDADWTLRKLAHAAEYAVLFFLVYRALTSGHSAKTRRALILAALVALLYAGSDEYHQTFVQGRQGRLRDVAVDAVGIGAAAYFIGKQRP